MHLSSLSSLAPIWLTISLSTASPLVCLVPNEERPEASSLREQQQQRDLYASREDCVSVSNLVKYGVGVPLSSAALAGGARGVRNYFASWKRLAEQRKWAAEETARLAALEKQNQLAKLRGEELYEPPNLDKPTPDGLYFAPNAAMPDPIRIRKHDSWVKEVTWGILDPNDDEHGRCIEECINKKIAKANAIAMAKPKATSYNIADFYETCRGPGQGNCDVPRESQYRPLQDIWNHGGGREMLRAMLKAQRKALNEGKPDPDIVAAELAAAEAERRRRGDQTQKQNQDDDGRSSFQLDLQDNNNAFLKRLGHAVNTITISNPGTAAGASSSSKKNGLHAPAAGLGGPGSARLSPLPRIFAAP